VMALKHLRGSWLGMAKLGKQPLGAILFANHRVKRTQLCYKKLSIHDGLYQRAGENLTNVGVVIMEKPLWARRSTFRLGNMEMLVTEVFVPKILEPLGC